MNWVDVIIVTFVVVAAIRGWFQGAIRQLAGWLGLFVGFIVGSMIAPSLSADITHSTWRPVLALAIVVASAFVGHFLGHLLGSSLRRTIKIVKLGMVDSGAGVAVAVVGALLTCWFAAGLLGSTAWGTLSSEIQGSKVLGQLDRVLPAMPSVEARLQTLIRNADLPSVFASITAPTLQPPASAKHLGPLVSGLTQPADVVKVLAAGQCANLHQGTAFFVAPHEAVTNAHVVAGADQITVGGAHAVVAFYDPVNDLAILRVPSLSEMPSTLQSSVPSTGTPARVVGYPLDGTRTGAPGAISGELSGQARDIYDTKLFNRTVLVVNAAVAPGNSGSPVFVSGRVVGVIFSKSLSQAVTAYAIPVKTLKTDLAKTPPTGVASTMGCVN